MPKVYWGWVTRDGEYIPVDTFVTGHQGYCEKRGLEEKKDFDDKGFVKVNTGSYWYTAHYKMTITQAKWLKDKMNIIIDSKNIAYN